ncbi:hypothetical protein [Gemmatimonas phototrophica]|uniref:Uncharacterized protein n=1 Tax=Gemmatimonas phototrophica TaxID=1379270 RepID=A0A143BII9_9BACT|nr:hypothetical protein [Gemmatimonas phototrophica]AMW04280.1 hypothetical protein GEMMAAP_04400 [Gemmatimonas phototrophica]
MTAPLFSAAAQRAPESTRAPLGVSETMGPLPNDHRFRWMGLGATVGAALAFGYHHASDRGERAGQCGAWDCALPYLSISGALTGLFLSRELAAQRRALAPRAGDALSFNAARLKLPAEAFALTVLDSLVFAATDSGVQVVTAAPRPAALQRRGGGLSLIRQVAVNGRDSTLLIGTGTALWQTPITAGRLSRLLPGAVDALAANEDIILVAEGQRLQIRHLRDGQPRVDTVVAPSNVSAAHYDATAKRWWVATDSALYEVMIPPAGSSASPVLAARTATGTRVSSISSGNNWIAAAVGTEGVIIWPRGNLAAQPTGVQQAPWRLKGEPRFAFDLAFMGDDLFVAGGVDGVTRIRLSPSPTILGASRQVAYATSIVARNGVLWVGDRSGSGLVRLVP